MTQSNQNYFNLTADGIGFLNRPREVQGKRKSSNYYACTIQASRGDNGEKTRFDLRIVGGQAKELFARLLEEFPQLLSKNYRERPTVVVGFRAGDIQPLKFETNNRETGEVLETLSIDGRLLKFKFIKVDGDMWYQSSSQDETQNNPDASYKAIEYFDYLRMVGSFRASPFLVFQLIAWKIKPLSKRRFNFPSNS